MAAKLPADGDKPGVRPHEDGADTTPALDVIEIAGSIKWFDVAKGFGKTTGYGVLLGLFGFVMWPILGFGKDQWQGAKELVQLPFLPPMFTAPTTQTA